MASKFMKIKRIIIPFISLVILTSQLMGCAAMSQEEVASELANGTEVEIELAEPSGEQEQEKEKDKIILEDMTDEEKIAALEAETGIKLDINLEDYKIPNGNIPVFYNETADTDDNGLMSVAEWEVWCAEHPEDLNKDMQITQSEIDAFNGVQSEEAETPTQTQQPVEQSKPVEQTKPTEQSKPVEQQPVEQPTQQPKADDSDEYIPEGYTKEEWDQAIISAGGDPDNNVTDEDVRKYAEEKAAQAGGYVNESGGIIIPYDSGLF